MRILICDDDHQTVEQLRKLVKSYFESIHLTCPELACFYDGKSLLEDKGEKDILFLDVEMPGVDGIQAGNLLKKENQNIIIFIVTFYYKYLDDAMRFCVFRYINKPIQKNRLFRNMGDALKLYETVSFNVVIETKESVCSLPASSILVVESQNKQVIVHTSQGDFTSVHNMHYWLEILPAKRFFQTHCSFIVNLEHIRDFDHSLVYMSDCNVTAYMTKRKYKVFKTAYCLYIESTRY